MKEIEITEINDINKEKEVLELVEILGMPANKGLITMLDKYFPAIDIEVIVSRSQFHLKGGILYILKNNDKRILVI